MLKEKLQQKLIKFGEDELLAFRDEKGIVWMSTNKTMRDIGLSEDQCKKQGKKFKEDIVISQGVKKMALPTNGGVQEVYVVKEDYVTLWLAKISLTPTMQRDNPKAVEKLVNYQLRCKDVLHEAFFETNEQKEKLFDELGLTGEIKELKNEVNGLTVELKGTQDKLSTLIDNSTINSRQASKILLHAKDRVNCLLGGANSKEYKKNSRKYFKNLWNDVAEKFEIATYKDLNPLDFGSCTTYITGWSYR